MIFGNYNKIDTILLRTLYFLRSMSFTESQQKIIDYVSTDESVKNDFLKAQSDLKGYDEQRTQEKKQNELWRLAQEYFKSALDHKDREAEALQQIYQETT